MTVLAGLSLPVGLLFRSALVWRRDSFPKGQGGSGHYLPQGLLRRLARPSGNRHDAPGSDSPCVHRGRAGQETTARTSFYRDEFARY